MHKLRKFFVLMLYFMFILFVANVAMGIAGLILKMMLITVQGPTITSRLLQIAVYYITIALLSYLIYKRNTKLNEGIHGIEIIVVLIFILTIESLINYSGRITLFLLLTSGTISVASFKYSFDVNVIESIREIPKVYFFVSDFIEFMLMSCFSLIGLQLGPKTSKLKQKSKTLSPFS